MLTVTNRNKDTLTDRYNGQFYIFEPNEPTPIPADAARHIFGYEPGDDRETAVKKGKMDAVLIRLGRLRSTDEQHVKVARNWLAKFQFGGQESSFDHHGPMVAVTNNWKELFHDRFDGDDYVIDVGKTGVMPIPAAQMFFGYGVEDKTPALIRQGWYNTQNPNTRKLADDILSQFQIEEVADATHPVDAGKGIMVAVR